MRNSLLLFIGLLVGNSCVDRLQFDVPEVEGTLVVDGYISDQPGPYSVRLLLLSKTTSVLNLGHEVTAKKVTLFDNEGNWEDLRNQGQGVYATDVNGIRGEVGKKYHLRIELPEGTIFESKPDELTPSGSIDSIYYEYESSLPISGPTQNGFRIYIDATSSLSGGFARWRYSGVFSLRTYPENNWSLSNCPPRGERAPLPCSGFVWSGFMKNVGPCTCCISYIAEPESKPHLNDNVIATIGNFKKEEMGYVTLDPYIFSENKYMLKVESMSLSKGGYEYWKVFRDQKEGATSLFQPAFGKAKTNIFSTNSDVEAGGFFYATAIRSRVAFISVNGSSLKVPPYKTQPPETNCGLWSTGEQIFQHSSIVPPPEWDCHSCTHYVVN